MVQACPAHPYVPLVDARVCNAIASLPQSNFFFYNKVTMRKSRYEGQKDRHSPTLLLRHNFILLKVYTFTHIKGKNDILFRLFPFSLVYVYPFLLFHVYTFSHVYFFTFSLSYTYHFLLFYIQKDIHLHFFTFFNKNIDFFIFQVKNTPSLTPKLYINMIVKPIIIPNNIFIIISSLLFASLHILSITKIIELLYIIPYLIIGLTFTLIYQKTDNILCNIISHILHNTINVLIIFINFFM